MDIALILGTLVPAAKYGGVAGETEESYNAIRWNDDRDKPSWDEIENTWPDVNQPTNHDLKLTGFEFEGVMVSATGIDDGGMLRVARAYDKGTLEPTMFYFENGNTLLITNDNFPALEIEWSAFRASFYKPE